MNRPASFFLTCVLALILPFSARCDEKPHCAFPSSPTSFIVTQNGLAYVSLSFGVWGPKWSWTSFRGTLTADGDASRFDLTTKIGGNDIALKGTAHLDGGKNLVIETNLSATKDTDLTKIVLIINPEIQFPEGTVTFTDTGKTSHQASIPLPIGSYGTVATIAMTNPAKQNIGIQLDPATTVTTDGGIRVELAVGKILASTPLSQKTTLTLPWTVTYYPDSKAIPSDDLSSWFPFTPNLDEAGDDQLSMQNWLEAPAGRHGRVLARGDELVYNGKPMKFWGINDCYGSAAPPKEMAKKEAAFYARNGINAVRFHKFAEGILPPAGSGFATLNPGGLDLMDYFVSQLKANGVYVELSPVFYTSIYPADHDAVPYWKEFSSDPWSLAWDTPTVVHTTPGSIYLGKELQDLRIAQITNLLKHVNPYTNMSYAQDPAIFMIEIQNEDSALFYGTQGQLAKFPTLRKRAGELFTAWLKKKYGTEAKLMAAWGPNTLNLSWLQVVSGESWDANTILPAGNPWFYDPDQLDGADGKTPSKYKPRMLDTMEFLYDLQNDYYDRFNRALRDAGYDGMVVTSNWRAGRAYSHLYNLKSDSRAPGPIDRHNYWGGMGSVLAKPGSGEFGVGLEQVADHPFMLSEWIHVIPNEYGVEGPAVIGAYGLGLQGWDASFIFQDTTGLAQFSKAIDQNNWEGLSPQVAGIYPAVARQVLRGDVSTATVTSVRNVTMDDLHQGKLGFDDRSSASGDIKTYGGKTVPSAALAAVRCLISFNDKELPTQPFDITPYLQGDAIKSSTGELLWQPGKDPQSGWISINTKGTKAVVGFAQGQKVAMGDVTITPQCRFAAIYLTAKEPDGTLDKSNALILSAIARARNTGMKILQDNFLLANGTAPVLMEPVQATITLTRPGTPTVHVLDTAGRLTEQTLPVVNGTFTIDTGRDKSCYYLVTY